MWQLSRAEHSGWERFTPLHPPPSLFIITHLALQVFKPTLSSYQHVSHRYLTEWTDNQWIDDQWEADDQQGKSYQWLFTDAFEYGGCDSNGAPVRST